ncbi:hypothetical protein ALO43_101237 [Pseudomonas tremae]|uniref:Uncharacterized protein n=2 Tax=Pseudomonas syringae group TaxID=136849 RepID=A0AB37QMK6_9PSED|nr:hypothetical protein OA77_07435 [Pseudomonas coronafaciens]KPY06331.1 hypothetical protein ALO57_101064 [Pseudomonas coronafaciens pv. oryzae]KPY92189.1 hypothetical protein ALO43_101237 [Pseudomonas tremae]KPZ25857.1 hypothetical protein ALO38_101000 [Pseudomonas coronafaciens pv. zizaniae]RMM84474.1 hypothetical protein ALQ71_101630 [Pseudomonas coronafaciens pv. striafaciens]RMR99042.1 hypothetical protein ALP74_200559 [Pseudomonas coronafaciens pv. garcae]RMS14510.1 hypothetical protei
MDIYGVRVRDASNVQTLGMEDFTIRKLASMVIPASRTSGEGIRSDYILMDVPNYDPAKCFVLITPRQYASYGQPGNPDAWGYVPTYKDLGGTSIGIFTYVNRRRPTGVGGRFRDEWIEHAVESVVEVVRVG